MRDIYQEHRNSQNNMTLYARENIFVVNFK